MDAVRRPAAALESANYPNRSTALPGAMNADDLVKACGSLTPVHPRSRLKVFLSKHYCIDGETATQSIKTGHPMAMYEAFIDSHEGQVVCYEGYEGMQKAFKEWIRQTSN